MNDPAPIQDPVLETGDRLMRRWPIVAAMLSVIGVVCSYIVTNWQLVEPIISSAPMIVLFMLLNLLLGGLAVYVLVSRPLEHRLAKAEGVINRLRERERSLEANLTGLKVHVAKLETRLDLLAPMPIAPNDSAD